MSWFDRAVANAGIEIKPPKEEPESTSTSAASSFLSQAGSLLDAWGKNVQNVYDTSPMYADIRSAGEAWDNDTSYKDPAAYYDNNTYAGSLANAIVGGGAGVVGGVADLLGLTKLGDRMNAVAQATQDPNAIEPEFSMEYATSPHGLTRSTGNTLGSILTMAPAAALMPEATALNIAGKLGKLGGNKVVQSLINKGHTTLAKRFAESLPMGVRWAGTTSGIEAMAEGGGTVRTAQEQGLDDPYGRGWKTAAMNLPGLVLSNVAEGALLGGLFKARPGASIPRRVAAVPGTAATEGIQNGIEEGAQQVIQNYNTDRPLTEGVPLAIKEGFAGSLLLGGAGGAYHAANANRFIDPEDTQEYRDWVNGAPKEQDYSNIQLPSTQQATPSPQGGGVSFDRLDDDIDAGGVSVDGARPETIGMINRAKQIYKEMFGRDDFWVSAVTGGHKDGTPHAQGYKADVGGSALEESQENRIKFQQALQAEGIGANNEYDIPSEGSTGGHFDLDSRGKNWQTGEEFGGFKGGAGNSAPQQSKTDMSSLPMGNIAQMVHNELARQGYNLPAEWIWAQMMHETGGPNPDYDLANIDHNYAGIKVNNYETQKVAGPAPDGGDYRHFDSDEDYAAYQARNLT